MSEHPSGPPIAADQLLNFACLEEGSLPCCSAELKGAGIEMLARLAALVAGRNPDARATIRFGDVVAFDDLVWRYPDFLLRAEAAYALLEAAELPE